VRTTDDADAMLIVCPTCATSYMIDPAALGSAGRMVRCARCKATWFAAKSATSELSEFVDDVIAEAETQSAGEASSEPPPPAPQVKPLLDTAPATADDDFGAEAAFPIAEVTAAGDDSDVESAPPPSPAESEPAPDIPSPIADAPSLVPPAEYEPLPDGVDEEALSADAESCKERSSRNVMVRFFNAQDASSGAE
jgi:predicted Zn finger-like uncharacterized protein